MSNRRYDPFSELLRSSLERDAGLVSKYKVESTRLISHDKDRDVGLDRAVKRTGCSLEQARSLYIDFDARGREFYYVAGGKGVACLREDLAGEFAVLQYQSEGRVAYVPAGKCSSCPHAGKLKGRILCALWAEKRKGRTEENLIKALSKTSEEMLSNRLL